MENSEEQMVILYRQEAAIYHKEGKYDKALETCEKVLDIYLELYGTEFHVNIAGVYCDIGTIYSDLNIYDEAMVCYEKALRIYEYCGEKGYIIARVLNGIGNSYAKLAAYDVSLHHKALDYYERALVPTQEKYGDDHPKTATLYDNMGYTYLSVGEDAKAYEYLKKAFDIRYKLYARESHLDLATSYMHLAHYYSRSEYNNKALEYLEKALILNMAVYGTEEHPSIAELYGALGEIYTNLERYSEALESFSKNLELSKNLYGENPVTAYAYLNTGIVYHSMGNREKAKFHYQKALDIMVIELPPNHPILSNILQYISIL